MQSSGMRSGRSITVTLLIVLVVAFVLQSFLFGYPPRLTSRNLFALSVEGLSHGYVWQLLTYQFMHGGLLHLLLNCWAIFIFGRELEEVLGRNKFLVLYFGSGVFGGLLQALSGVMFGGGFAAPVVGASAAAFGLVAAFALLYPDRPLTMLLFFIIPINIRAKYLLLISFLLAAFGIAFPSDNLAHAAHMGGMLAGMFFIRHGVNWQMPSFRRSGGSQFRRLIRVKTQPNRPEKAIQIVEENSGDEFVTKEIDPILDKISAHGIQSLTPRERQILENARAKMGKR